MIFPTFTREFRRFTREFSAFTHEFRRFTREFGAFTREFRRFTREFFHFSLIYQNNNTNPSGQNGFILVL
jgi:hypothetical protein